MNECEWWLRLADKVGGGKVNVNVNVKSEWWLRSVAKSGGGKVNVNVESRKESGRESKC